MKALVREVNDCSQNVRRLIEPLGVIGCVAKSDTNDDAVKNDRSER